MVPHHNKTPIKTLEAIAEKQELCQLMADFSEASESLPAGLADASLFSRYRSLRCELEALSPSSAAFKSLSSQFLSGDQRSETGGYGESEPTTHPHSASTDSLHICRIYRVHKDIEDHSFRKHRSKGNRRLLYHATKPSNAFGILSRGLLLPKVVVDTYGGARTDAGMLGSGIYFADRPQTSVQYSTPSAHGTRFMFVSEVALGKSFETTKHDTSLSSPPPGYHSVVGVGRGKDASSQFADNEFVVYDNTQQRLAYLVEFAVPGDAAFGTNSESALQEDGAAGTTASASLPSSSSARLLEDAGSHPTPSHHHAHQHSAASAGNGGENEDIHLNDVLNVADPLEKVEAGLMVEGARVPLKSVHVRAKLVDLAAEVVVLQAYKNESSAPVEAKYVFPLDDMAAVCGFEAFINGKHVVGKVKEKEQAHREYKEAIAQGHGAYLMDEETPDVFTVSVGNLPPGAHVLIKITYVAELVVDGEDVVFSLPGSVAPTTRNKALDQVRRWR